MMRTTPFYPRLVELNESHMWGNWSGFLSAVKFDLSSKHEYFGVRNAAGFFDTSPLHKYWIRGRDAERLCSYVFARDIRPLRQGRAQYTVWCDDSGHVLEDGVVFRMAADEFLLTAAEPNLGYLAGLARPFEAEIVDASEDYASMAIQGPRSREILAGLTDDAAELAYFGFSETKIAGSGAILSRTGFSGDLGFEIMVPADDAIHVLDAVIEAGRPHGLRPYGEEALNMTRIEAGLPLIAHEFTSSRYAFTAEERFTPDELGLGWVLRGIEDESRPFIGRRALLAERSRESARWRTVGVTVEWRDYYDLHQSRGLLAVPNEVPVPWEVMIYDAAGSRIGYATSFMYSPILQKHIGIARVRPTHAHPEAEIYIEQTVDHEYVNVRGHVTTLPFYNPARKTA